MALKTIVVDNLSDVTEVITNPDTLEAVITVCTLFNGSDTDQSFELLLGTTIEDRKVIYRGTVPTNSEFDMTKKFNIPGNKTLWMSMGGSEGYAVFSIYQQSIDMAAIEASIDDKLNESRLLRDETKSFKEIVVNKESLVNSHYTAIDTVADNINAINHADQLITEQLTKYKGAYDSGTKYDIGDAVSYEGNIYISKQGDNTGNTPKDDSDYWVLVTSQTSANKVKVDASSIEGLDATNVQGAFDEHQGDINNIKKIVKANDGDNTVADYVRIKDSDNDTIWQMSIENGEIKLTSEGE